MQDDSFSGTIHALQAFLMSLAHYLVNASPNLQSLTPKPPSLFPNMSLGGSTSPVENHLTNSRPKYYADKSNRTLYIYIYIYALDILPTSVSKEIMWRLLTAIFMVFGDKAEVYTPS